MWCLDMGMAMQACQACGVTAPERAQRTAEAVPRVFKG